MGGLVLCHFGVAKKNLKLRGLIRALPAIHNAPMLRVWRSLCGARRRESLRKLFGFSGQSSSESVSTRDLRGQETVERCQIFETIGGLLDREIARL